MKEFLSRSGHSFLVKNVEEDEKAYDELIALGHRTVPLTVIGEHLVRGYDPVRLQALLDAAAQSSADR